MRVIHIPTSVCALAFVACLVIGGSLPSSLAAEDGAAPASGVVSPSNPIEQALTDIKSEEAAVRSVVAVLIEQGNASLIPNLDAIRAEANHATRQAIKPVIDLLKNHANLTSEQPDIRRLGVVNLGGSNT